jgi:hypothetical protein
MSISRSSAALDLVERSLKGRLSTTKTTRFTYTIPSLWISDRRVPAKVKVNPFKFYSDVVNRIRDSAPVSVKEEYAKGGEWTNDAVVYNMFVRTAAAFDHNGNGSLDLPLNDDGFRETGTFLKAIAMLPYVKRLGANTIHLLPITSIGRDGSKGTLGSPYAIRNPYELDEKLGEPFLGLDARTEFKAFVEAAHLMGMRVVVEFVFRTAAKDGDWAVEHPEWFYWIRDDIQDRQPDESRYGSPLFTREELEWIHHQVREHRFDNLLQPHRIYRDFFTQPPGPGMVTRDDERLVGVLSDGRRVRIPGAFADWPPDDNQPPWGDVTYLRLYTHPDFNYIAYNTVRMYDSNLAQTSCVNRALWDRIVGIIPHYQKEFHIDGVMIDMGHALPMELKSEIVKTARAGNPDFAFWEENFAVNRRSREEGYNAVVGYCWIDQYQPAKMKAICRRMATEGFPLPFFATAETHNTPRAAARPGGVTYSKWAWVINNLMPAIPFIHSGFETAERYPINTGLDFTKEDLEAFPSEKLPLFSEHAYDWLNPQQITGWIRRVSAIRRQYRELILNQNPHSFVMLHENNERVVAFARVSDSARRRLAAVGNANFFDKEHVCVDLRTKMRDVTDLVTGKEYTIHEGNLRITLDPGQWVVFEC